MDNEWVSREVKRAQALQIPAAEPRRFFPDKALASKRSFDCVPLQQATELPALLEERKSHEAPYCLALFLR